MFKARDSSRKQKIMNKTALSALNLKKTDMTMDSTQKLAPSGTYRPKYVQKQWKEEPGQSSNKKSFFNKTQTTTHLNRSFERTQQRICDRDLKSKTPSPLRQKFSQNLLQEKQEQKQLIDKLFSIKRKQKEQAIVQNLIMNILGKDDDDHEKPQDVIKKLNKQLVELRHKNIRLEKEIKELIKENSKLRKKQTENAENSQLVDKSELEDLLLQTFQLIVIAKTAEVSESDVIELALKTLYDKSNTVMIKLNPFVLSCSLQTEMKERGLKVKQELLKKPMNIGQPDRFPLSCLMKTLNSSNSSAPYIKNRSLVSTSGQSRACQRRQRESSKLNSARVISEEPEDTRQDLTFDNFKTNECQNSVICHHSKDVSYGGIIEDHNRERSQPSMNMGATALLDFTGDNQNDLSLKKGDRLTVLKKTSSGWWIGMINNVVGYFPSSSVKLDS